MGRLPSPEHAADWGAFADTLLHFDSTPPHTIDLRRVIDGASRQSLCDLGFERSFGIISAQDPMGLRHPAAENERLAASLQQEVAALIGTQLRVTACSPDGSHCEESIAIALDLRMVIDLADRYRQLAIFWFDGDAFWIIPVRSSKAKVRLPLPA